MSYETTGTLVKIYETETKGESYRVRDFVIKANDGGQYDNFVKFQTTQDRTAIMDDHQEGDKIKVHFDIRGRQWQEKYFQNLNAWRVEKVSAAEPTASESPAPKPAAKPEPVPADNGPLPF